MSKVLCQGSVDMASESSRLYRLPPQQCYSRIAGAHPQAVPVVDERKAGRARQGRAYELLHNGRRDVDQSGVSTAQQLLPAGQQQVRVRVLRLRAQDNASGMPPMTGRPDLATMGPEGWRQDARPRTAWLPM